MISKASQAKLKELRDSGNWCCIEIKSDYMYVWDVYLTRGYRTGGREDKHEPCVFSGACEDLNEAINRVYERAKKYLEEEK